MSEPNVTDPTSSWYFDYVPLDSDLHLTMPSERINGPPTLEFNSMFRDGALSIGSNTSRKREKSVPPSTPKLSGPVHEPATGSDRRKKPRRGAVSSSEKHKLFACPYYKHDPTSHGLHNTEGLGCVKHLLRTISALKQHLDRTHRRPQNYCVRCYQSFKNHESVAQHTRTCNELVEVNPYERTMSPDAWDSINRRSHKGQSAEDAWYSIYAALFPREALPPSPYVDELVQSAEDRLLSQFLVLLGPGVSRLVAQLYDDSAILRGDLIPEKDHKLIRETLAIYMNDLH